MTRSSDALRVVSAGITAWLLLGMPCGAQTVERAMREAQARYDFISRDLGGELNPHTWPSCGAPCTPNGGPEYPIDGYYGEVTNEEGACLAHEVVTLMRSIIGAQVFLDEVWVDGISELSVWNVADPAALYDWEDDGFAEYCEAYLNDIGDCEGEVDETNWENAVADSLTLLEKLRFTDYDPEVNAVEDTWNL